MSFYHLSLVGIYYFFFSTSVFKPIIIFFSIICIFWLDFKAVQATRLVSTCEMVIAQSLFFYKNLWQCGPGLVRIVAVLPGRWAHCFCLQQKAFMLGDRNQLKPVWGSQSAHRNNAVSVLHGDRDSLGCFMADHHSSTIAQAQTPLLLLNAGWMSER